jgi:hypothetical protein
MAHLGPLLCALETMICKASLTQRPTNAEKVLQLLAARQCLVVCTDLFDIMMLSCCPCGGSASDTPSLFLERARAACKQTFIAPRLGTA